MCSRVDTKGTGWGGSWANDAAVYGLISQQYLPICPGGEIGRRKGLKIPRGQPRAGSIPAPGTINTVLASTDYFNSHHSILTCGIQLLQ